MLRARPAWLSSWPHSPGEAACSSAPRPLACGLLRDIQRYTDSTKASPIARLSTHVIKKHRFFLFCARVFVRSVICPTICCGDALFFLLRSTTLRYCRRAHLRCVRRTNLAKTRARILRRFPILEGAEGFFLKKVDIVTLLIYYHTHKAS